MAQNKFEKKIRHTKLELDQHIEIMQLQDKVTRMTEALKKILATGWQNWRAHDIANEALSEYNQLKGGQKV